MCCWYDDEQRVEMSARSNHCRRASANITSPLSIDHSPSWSHSLHNSRKGLSGKQRPDPYGSSSGSSGGSGSSSSGRPSFVLSHLGYWVDNGSPYYHRNDSYELSKGRTRKHARAHVTHSCTHTRKCMHARVRAHTIAHSTHAHTRMHTHTHTRKYTHARTHAHTHRTHIRTRARSLTHAHACTQACLLAPRQ
jgi:hypothetical protein